ncbi:lipopolysaccharide biosynthesis protein [Opacimonas viscosa]|uniref:Lipopolysaccharide biosynthesis protein n=1 Tax=Opacimonas viscosa TaxID=2961944 RepID=A0AA41X338_9ALTE|nr:lipopolysaccharide biosynthesis protein [Opacimonas viscosa]MCP3429123.1 lipopolysaccharide biosynthesis protein [Opacimonas viscosa]
MLKNYTFTGLFRLARDLVVTKIFYSNARLIRYPYYFRGLERINFGKNITLGVGVRIDAFGEGQVLFGENCQLNDYVHIGARSMVVIGDNVLIASKVFISDHNHGNFPIEYEIHLPPALRKESSNPVEINDDVWIGESVSILPGVKIGKGSIIGSNSVVTKNIPNYAIAVGAPARVIKLFNFNLNKWEKV